MFAEQISVKLDSGLDVPGYFFGHDHARASILWLPSQYGFSPAQITISEKLSRKGLNVLTVDLHSAYFMMAGRDSVTQFASEDGVGLIQWLVGKYKKPVIIMSSERGTQFAMRSSHAWQQQHPGQKQLQGHIVFYPYVYEKSPNVGEDGIINRWIEANNLPVFYIQPELSTKRWRMNEITKALSQSGAEVYTQFLTNIRAGFMSRPEEELNQASLTLRNHPASFVLPAVEALIERPTPTSALTVSEEKTAKPSQPGSVLLPYTGKQHSLALADINDRSYDMTNYRDKVVLISFWASWCPPCIEEMPSLIQLYEQKNGNDFQLLSVDMGEPLDDIQQFVKEFSVPFPVLYDERSRVATAWGVYAFPTNFLVDRAGNIRYSSAGAINWQSKEALKVIDSC